MLGQTVPVILVPDLCHRLLPGINRQDHLLPPQHGQHGQRRQALLLPPLPNRIMYFLNINTLLFLPAPHIHGIPLTQYRIYLPQTPRILPVRY